MNFSKMHGIGNDFVMVDCLGTGGGALAAEAQSRAVFLNDRKFGIGGDGVILALPGEKHPFRMRMFNPDGSEAEMCGNGIRCLAKLIVDGGYAPADRPVEIETLAGLMVIDVYAGGDGKVERARVDMGEPILEPARIPTTLSAAGPSGFVVDVPLELSDRTLRVTAVSMGNPHAVTFVDDTAAYPVEAVGPEVEWHCAFPRRTNTEFIQVLGRGEINFRVWERGAGETLACGTGACAAVVACVLNGKTDRDVLVHLPGGDLRIQWSAENNRVYMTGGAAHVFDGEI